MSLSIPPEMKVLTAFIRRGEELEKDQTNPDCNIVAYYCKTYAMEKGIKMKLSSPEVNTFLITLMDSLESSKKSLQINPESGPSICEMHALSVFDKADDEDRAGEANKATAKTFYTASTFFDILEQFGELDPELVEKRKYSKWKAADILNAIKQGLKPTIGAPGEESQSDSPSSSRKPAADLSSVIPAAPTFVPQAPVDIPQAPFAVPPPTQQYNQPQQKQYQPQPQHQPSPQHSPHPSAPSYPSSPIPPPTFNSNMSSKAIATNADSKVKDAIEYASFAIAALKHNNIALAKERLIEALRQIE